MPNRFVVLDDATTSVVVDELTGHASRYAVFFHLLLQNGINASSDALERGGIDTLPPSAAPIAVLVVLLLVARHIVVVRETRRIYSTHLKQI